MSGVIVHATAIRVGRTGLLIVGPSGAGKSTLALSLLSAARRSGHVSALVGDDQVRIRLDQGLVIAEALDRMTGAIEIRGSGIGHWPAIRSTPLDRVLAPVTVDAANRQPDPDARHEVIPGVSLPLLPIDRQAPDPWAICEAMIAGFPE